MKKTIFALSGVLAVQVVLAVWMHLSAGGLAGQQAGTPLLSFAAGDVQRLSITDGDGQSVILTRAGDDWSLPDEDGFPANSEKVKTLLADLTAAEESPPVATSDAAVTRFRVAEDAFERKLVFGPADKPLATVYLGSTEGTRQVHVRRADQDGVRRIAFGIYRVPASADGWVDSAVLQVDADKIAALAWGDVRIERSADQTDAPAAQATEGKDAATPDAPAAAGDGGSPPPAPSWQLAGTPPQPLPAAPVKALTDELSSLRITGLADAQGQTADAEKDPALDLTITLRDGKTKRYRILKQAENGGYEIAASDQPRLMKLSNTAAEALIKAAGDKAFAPVRAGMTPAGAGADTPGG